jgi:dTMP kinase
MSQGLFISFEGTDGCGKSTQIKAMQAYLEEENLEFSVYREPGGVALSEQIREILLDPKNTALCDESELMLYTASRLQLLEEKVLPDLKKGFVVILDRFADSTTAYQGYGRELDLEQVDSINQIVRQKAWPQRTYWLDVDVALGLGRTTGGGDRMEQAGLAFFNRVREGYGFLYADDPERILRLDATLPLSVVKKTIRKDLERLIETWKST